MSGAQHGTGGASARADGTTAGTTATADAEGTAPATDTTRSPAPLSSLTSLLGGTIEGGTTCTTDGGCD